MTATLHGPLTVANGGSPTAPRWAQGRSDPIARALAQKWGRTPKTVEHELSGPHSIFLRCADAIREYRAQGAENRLARASRELLAALEGREAPPLCAAVWHQAAEADAAEEVCESDYRHDPSPANRDRYIRALDREILRQTALRDALLADERAGA